MATSIGAFGELLIGTTTLDDVMTFACELADIRATTDQSPAIDFGEDVDVYEGSDLRTAPVGTSPTVPAAPPAPATLLCAGVTRVA